jgi:hypothetical protein
MSESSWGRGRGRTDVDKLHRRDFGFKLAERSIELLATRKFPKPTQYVRHRIRKSGTRAFILRREPFFQFGRGGDTLCGWQTGTAVYELCDVLERAAAGVVE